ncbi:DUF6531 domain-containing protein, partial [Pseudomonas sp. H1h]|uniref:DUF6531 domain-containing protein n=1 Tax=Pseudomonas sp. H1h TaxID=1397280 RepID=UPI00210C0A7A
MFQTDRLLALNNSIGPSGILQVSDCDRGQRYRITFFPDVSTAQVKALYASYEGILGGLEGRLRDEWAGFQPLWTEFSSAGFGDRYRQLQQADWRGLEKALHDIWDDIKQLFALLADLQANSEKLLQHASALKPLLVNARDVPLKPTPAIPLNIRQADSQVLTVPNPAPMARDKSRNTTRMERHEPRDDASNQAKNPNGDSADCALLTCTNGCPVSMVTGEELLTLTDGTLDGRLPFEFTRLYRTSAVEIDVGL